MDIAGLVNAVILEAIKQTNNRVRLLLATQCRLALRGWRFTFMQSWHLVGERYWEI